MVAGDTRQCRQGCPAERGHSAGRGHGLVSAPAPSSPSRWSAAQTTPSSTSATLSGGSRSTGEPITDVTRKALHRSASSLPARGETRSGSPQEGSRLSPAAPRGDAAVRSAGTRRRLPTGLMQTRVLGRGVSICRLGSRSGLSSFTSQAGARQSPTQLRVTPKC